MKQLCVLLLFVCSLHSLQALQIKPQTEGLQVRKTTGSKIQFLRYQPDPHRARQPDLPWWFEPQSQTRQIRRPHQRELKKLQAIHIQYRWIKQTTVFGSGAGQFRDPISISLDEFGHIYVVDRAEDSISKFSTSLSWLNTFGGFEWDRTNSEDLDDFSNLSEARFDSPYDIACTNRLSCFITDMRNHRIAELDLDGNFLREIRPRRRLDEPTTAGITSRNELYILDSRNDRIQVFSSMRRPLHMIGGYGHQKERLSRPRDFTLVGDNTLIVLDQGNQEIKKFATNGHFLESMDWPDSDPHRICSSPSTGLFFLMHPDKTPTAYSPHFEPQIDLLPSSLAAARDCIELPSGRLLFLHASPPAISTLQPVWSVKSLDVTSLSTES